MIDFGITRNRAQNKTQYTYLDEPGIREAMKGAGALATRSNALSNYLKGGRKFGGGLTGGNYYKGTTAAAPGAVPGLGPDRGGRGAVPPTYAPRPKKEAPDGPVGGEPPIKKDGTGEPPPPPPPPPGDVSQNDNDYYQGWYDPKGILKAQFPNGVPHGAVEASSADGTTTGIYIPNKNSTSGYDFYPLSWPAHRANKVNGEGNRREWTRDTTVIDPDHPLPEVAPSDGFTEPPGYDYESEFTSDLDWASFGSGGGMENPEDGYIGKIMDYMESEGYSPEERAAMEGAGMLSTRERLGETATQAALQKNITGDTAGFYSLAGDLAGAEGDIYANQARDIKLQQAQERARRQELGTGWAMSASEQEEQNLRNWMNYIAQLASLRRETYDSGASTGGSFGIGV